MKDDPILETAKELVKAVGKDVYEDGVKEAVVELRPVLSAIARTLGVLVANPVHKGLDRLQETFPAIFGDRVKQIPPERRIEPEPRIASTVCAGLLGSGGEPDIVEMFANLLATSMDKDTAHLAHASHVEIIKQLSPDEARILRYLKDAPGFVSYRLNIKRDDRIQSILFTDLGARAACLDPDPERVSLALDTLFRLGMIERPPSGRLNADQTLWGDLDARLKDWKPRPGCELAHVGSQSMGDYELSHFGRQFVKACVRSTSR